MRADPDVQKFLRAAKQRLTAAEFLASGQHWLDASYLAGYAPECALKALILARTPAAQRPMVRKDHFRSAKGHNLDHLKALLAQRKVFVPPEVATISYVLPRGIPT